MLISLVCPNCGAPMEVDDAKETILCPHCGTKVLNQQETLNVNQHIVIEHKKEKDPHTLIVNYKSSDKNVKLVIAIQAVKRKDVIISGQKMRYILAPGQYRIVLKIGKINYNRDIVVPKDGTPVEIIASWAGKANISIDQPLYDPAEIANAQARTNVNNVQATPSKPYSERTYKERVFRKGMIAPWIICGVLLITGLSMLSGSPAGGLITILSAILICPLIIELICKYINPDKVKLVKILIFVAVGILAIVGVSISAAQSPESDSTVNKSSKDVNVESASFTRTDDVYINAGQTISRGYVRVNVKDRDEFTPDNVVFVSENSNIATISFSHDALTTCLYYDITGVSEGETEVYVTDIDGNVISEKVKVIVTDDRVKAESITLTSSNTTLSLGETSTLLVDFNPANTTEVELTWKSSDESVVTVDKNGTITAVGGGFATISATTSNDITESVEITVDASKRNMKLRVTHPRDDDVNIGDDWTYYNSVNGEYTKSDYTLSVGDTLSFYSKYTEEDSSVDVGEASTSYTVTEEDLANGFAVKLDVYVTEDGGKNKGKQAHFVATYTFTLN